MDIKYPNNPVIVPQEVSRHAQKHSSEKRTV